MTLAALMADRHRLVDCVAIDTDAQALRRARAHRRIHVGQAADTPGAGGDPAAAEGARDAQALIERAVMGSSLVIVTGGLGGGTASGVIPMVAEIARRSGALTVGVVSKPFAFEGGRRRAVAEQAIRELTEHVDAVAALPNERVREIISSDASIEKALEAIDQTLRSTIDAILDMAHQGGPLGLDFASARSLLRDAGAGLVGVGRAAGETRAADAVRQAIAGALADGNAAGTRSIVMNVTASRRLRLVELDQAVEEVRATAGAEPDIMLGLTIDRRLGKALQVTLIVAGASPSAAPAEPTEHWLPVWRRARNEPPLEADSRPAPAADAPPARVRRGKRALRPDLPSELAG